MKEITTTKKFNIRIRNIVIGVLTVVILAGIISFLTLTATGRAIVFAITDPATVNEAAQMKADYVKSFELSASPKQ